MGYDVHVFRGADWTSPQHVERAEWDHFLASVDGIRLVDHVETTTPSGDVVRLEGAFLEWSGHSSARPIPLSVRISESITMRNPDDEGIAFLVELATKLHGRVQGDEGEFYDGAPQTRPTAPDRRRRFGKRRK